INEAHRQALTSQPTRAQVCGMTWKVHSRHTPHTRRTHLQNLSHTRPTERAMDCLESQQMHR
ncbi:hypothetical protein SARC_14765, partial [Sphaeroforma arctica JP610]